MDLFGIHERLAIAEGFFQGNVKGQLEGRDYAGNDVNESETDNGKAGRDARGNRCLLVPFLWLFSRNFTDRLSAVRAFFDPALLGLIFTFLSLHVIFLPIVCSD